MNAIELFAGAGGAALGLSWAGIRLTALVELCPIACQTLRANGFDRVYTADLRICGPWLGHIPDGPARLLWASFPCQPWSSAGSKKGTSDDRNGWPWTITTIDALRVGGKLSEDGWFVGENVVGLSRHKKGCPGRGGLLGPVVGCPGCYLDPRIMSDLRDRFPRSGWFILDAADFGTPQRRRRVFIWAGPAELAPPARTHGTELVPWVSVKAALGLDVILDGGRNSGANPRQERPITCDEPCFTIGTRGNQVLRLPGGGKRRLEPAEVQTLMGFPESYRISGGPRNTKSARYLQLGNAVAPQVAKALGQAILQAEARYRCPTKTNDPTKTERRSSLV